MRFKQFFPWVSLLLLAAAALVLMWILSPRPEEEIERAVLEHVRTESGRSQRVEGRDFSIGKVALLRRDDRCALVDVELQPGERHLFYRLASNHGRWSVDANLQEDFLALLRRPDFARGMSDRLGPLLAEKWRLPVTVTLAGKPVVPELRREENDVVGSCRSAYEIPGRDGKTDEIDYVECFRYQDGQWILEGPGRIFWKVPR